MSVLNLTSIDLSTLPLPEDASKDNVIYWHDDDGGRRIAKDVPPASLGLKCRKGGGRSWVGEMRVNGVKIRNTYGSPDKGMNLAAALRERDLDRLHLSAGRDPKRVQRAPAAAPATKRQTVAELISSYIGDLQERLGQGKLRPSYVGKLKRNLPKVAAVWGSREVASIGREDIKAFLDGYSNEPARQEEFQAHIRSMFSHWVDSTTGAVHPGIGMKKRGGHRSKVRFLSDGELAIFWASLLKKLDRLDGAEMVYPGDHILALIALTSRRPDEVSKMEWSEVDLVEKTWRLPGDPKERFDPTNPEGNGVAKNGEPHTLPLLPLAIRVLEDAKRHIVGAGRFVFHRGKDEAPTCSYRKVLAYWRQLLAPATTKRKEPEQREAFTPHDLRRTAGTTLEILGAPDGVMTHCLNHTPSKRGVSAIYLRMMSDGEMRMKLLRDWLERLEDHYRGQAVKLSELERAGSAAPSSGALAEPAPMSAGAAGC
jgi:integrase